MYTYIEAKDGYDLISSEGEYMCHVYTEEKADFFLALLNESLNDFDNGNYSIAEV